MLGPIFAMEKSLDFLVSPKDINSYNELKWSKSNLFNQK
jgi:hypothetical protein